MPRAFDYLSFMAPSECSGLAFGFEAEYSIEESQALTEAYAPLAQFKVDLKIWRAWSWTLRRDWLKSAADGAVHGEKRVLLEKTDHSPEWSFLPPTVFRDDTGNLEIVTSPVPSWAEFRAQVQLINQRFGRGSMQAMISLPRERFFQSVAGDASRAALEHLGWLGFFNELDILERLESGRRKLLERPEIEAVRTFSHPYLGPMVEVRHKLLRKFLAHNSRGEMLDEESLIRPARRDHSFKFIGSTAYRPDIAAPHRICFEVRDAHRDESLLLNRVARVILFWDSHPELRKPFGRFAEVATFDSERVFAGLEVYLQDFLKALFPLHAPPEALPYEKPRFSYEVFRNFTYPLKPWDTWLQALRTDERTADDLKRRALQIQDAQSLYRQSLELCFADWERAAQDGERHADARKKVQAALAQFASQSGLLELFCAKERELVRWDDKV